MPTGRVHPTLALRVAGLALALALLLAPGAQAATLEAMPGYGCIVDESDWRDAAATVPHGDASAGIAEATAYASHREASAMGCPEDVDDWTSRHADSLAREPARPPNAAAAAGEDSREDAPPPLVRAQHPHENVVKGALPAGVLPSAGDAPRATLGAGACRPECAPAPAATRVVHVATGAHAPAAASLLPAARPDDAPARVAPAHPQGAATAQTAPSTGATPQVSAAFSPAQIAFAFSAALASLLAIAGGFYSRVTRARALEHPVRCALYEKLRERPGRTPQELATALALNLDAVRYHLRRLTLAGLIASRRVRQRARYYVPGTQVDLAAEEATATPLARQMVETLRETAGLPLAELSRRLERKPPLVHYHLKKLVAARLVVAEGKGLSRVYRPASGDSTPA